MMILKALAYVLTGGFSYYGLIFLLTDLGYITNTEVFPFWINIISYTVLFIGLHLLVRIIDIVSKTILYSLFGEKIFTNSTSYNLIMTLNTIFLLLWMLLGYATILDKAFVGLHIDDNARFFMALWAVLLFVKNEKTYHELVEEEKDNNATRKDDEDEF